MSLDPFARTVDSLEALALDDPVFLVGADEFAAFLAWKEPERVLELARLGVATRPGVDRAGLDARARAGSAGPSGSRSSRSSRCPSRRPTSGRASRPAKPIGGLVPAAVEAEIARLGLYRRVDRRRRLGVCLESDPIEGTTPT